MEDAALRLQGRQDLLCHCLEQDRSMPPRKRKQSDKLIPMLSSFVQVLMRVMCALLLTRVIGNEGVFWGEVCAWIGADLLLTFTFVKRLPVL